MSIQPLPPDVVAQINSSITITSLNGVMCELIKNSLDANASKVNVIVDYGRGSCSVDDDGFGILPAEFQPEGHLGKLHHSSKLNAQTPVHGGRGTFLASLSAMALVSITSHHHLHRSHNTLTLHKSEVVSRQTPVPAHRHLENHHGTRVVVQDLFGNMPVRVKHRAILAEKERGNSKDWEMLRREVIGFLLPWPRTVAISIRDAQTNHKWGVRPSSMSMQSGGFSVTSLCSILTQASFIAPDQKTSWISIHASTPKFDISGAVSLEPAASKHVQFISLSIHPIVGSEGQSVFHDEINQLFTNSAFGAEEYAEEIDSAEQYRRAQGGRYKGDIYTNKELKAVKKGINRWPMFFINIELSDPAESKSAVGVLDAKKQTLTGILELLRVLILEFLTKNNFRPKFERSRAKKDSEVVVPTSSTSRTVPESASSSVSSRCSQARAKRPATHQNGSSIRLPSFRQGLTESPFDSWSRAKKGATTRLTTPKAPGQDIDSRSISRPATAPPALSDISSISVISSPRRPTIQPLLSKAGKLLRAPFDGVALAPKPTSDPVPSSPSLSPKLGPWKAPGDDDDLLPWTNPVTRVQTFINPRTGLTMTMAGQSSYSNQTPRLTSYPSTQKPPQSTPSPWIRNLMKTWKNPIYAPAEPSISRTSFDGLEATTQNILHGHQHHCSDFDIDRAFKEVSSGINGRISKDALRHAEVVSQVDQKFVLVKLPPSKAVSENRDASMLVLIDQHAADERIRVEALMEEFCTSLQTASTGAPRSGIVSATLAKALHFDVSIKELKLLEIHQQHFFNWGIIFAISTSTPNSSSCRLIIHSLPPSILERCQASPRLLIDLIRTELWKVHDNHTVPSQPLPVGDWLQRIHTCPQGILDMINSRACRSAIMFNDVLSKEQCQLLVERLAECKFPFQCAHGRPSLVPLVHLEALSLGGGVQPKEEEDGFGKVFGRWKENLR